MSQCHFYSYLLQSWSLWLQAFAIRFVFGLGYEVKSRLQPMSVPCCHYSQFINRDTNKNANLQKEGTTLFLSTFFFLHGEFFRVGVQLAACDGDLRPLCGRVV